LSHTPSTQAALNRYAAQPFKQTNFGAYISGANED
jgi:hypothetical protein